MNPETRSTRIERLLRAQFTPSLLEVQDESAHHAGHGGARPGGQTHFHVKMITDSFAGMNKVARHRAVYAVLAGDMVDGGIHALALDLRTPDEN